MKLTGGQVFAIFIVVIMLGSIVSVFTFGPAQQPAQQGPNVPAPIENTTILSYDATGVSAKVIQVFPTALLIANTTSLETLEIDTALRKVPGITLVSGSQFVDSEGAGVNFRTSLRFESAEKIPAALAAINEIPILSSVEVFPQALVTVPDSIEFKNAGLELTLGYSFPSKQLQAYVSDSTKSGDEIKITIQADFKGQSFAGSVAYEEQEPQQAYFVDGEFTISSLESDYFLRTTAPLSQMNLLESAKAEIIAASQDPAATIEIAPASNSTLIYFSSPENIFEQDLNTFLSNFTGVSSFSLQLDQNFASVNFDGNAGEYTEFRDSLRAQLDSLGFKVATITEPVVSLQGNTSASQGKQEFLDLVEASAKKNSLQIEVLQKAVIDANTIFVPDVNADFAVAQGKFQAYVNTAHKSGDSVNLSLLIFGSKKDGAVQIQAQEADTAAQP